MEHLPNSVQRDLLGHREIEVSDWVKNAIHTATKIEVHDHERTLADKLIQHAYMSATKTGYPVGNALAAAFDLFVAADYYKNVAHRGWYYCPVGEYMPTLRAPRPFPF